MAKLKLVKRNKNVAPAAPAAAPAPAASVAKSRNTTMDAQTRHNRIAIAAYYRAERRGFAPGCEAQDWLEAEKDIERTSISAA